MKFIEESWLELAIFALPVLIVVLFIAGTVNMFATEGSARAERRSACAEACYPYVWALSDAGHCICASAEPPVTP